MRAGEEAPHDQVILMTHESYILLCSRPREPGRVDKDEGGSESEEARELTQEAVILLILLVDVVISRRAASLNRWVTVCRICLL